MAVVQDETFGTRPRAFTLLFSKKPFFFFFKLYNIIFLLIYRDLIISDILYAIIAGRQELYLKIVFKVLSSGTFETWFSSMVTRIRLYFKLNFH